MKNPWDGPGFRRSRAERRAEGSGRLVSPRVGSQTGIDPYLNVITAQTTLLSDQQTEVTLRVNETTAAVQLIQALGGGCDRGQLPSAGEVTRQNVADRLERPR